MIVGSDRHLGYLIMEIDRYAMHPAVKKIMVGKTSIKRDQHLHAGMVSRFNSKYKKAGYKLMIGLVILDGNNESSQKIILNLENNLHAEFDSREKFVWDAKLSFSSSGKKNKQGTDSDYYFMLYLAVAQ